MPPVPPDPPPPDWDSVSGASAEFKDAHDWANTYGYDSADMAIKDVNGDPNYLYVGKSATAGHCAWFLRTPTYSGDCPQAKIPSATFDVIKGGTLNAATGVISYGGHTYQLDLRRDDKGVQIANAKQLT
jgi:hypothetical protein